MALPVARTGDPDVPHCSPMVRAQGSRNVFVNGRGCQRVGDLNTSHLRPAGKKCKPHRQPIFTGGSVIVNGRPIGREGDLTCTSVAKGSPDVLAG
jgi:uncharacterized Zn-binding protein involved in type VI secretion